MEQEKEQKLHPRQLKVLQAVIEALLPPLPPPNNNEHQKDFWQQDLCNNPDFLTALQKAIDKLPGQEKFLLQCLLYVMSFSVGTALVFGLPTFQAFPDYSTQARTDLLIRLQLSRFQEQRKIFSGLKRLICGLAFSFVDDKNKTNPYWKDGGYPGPFEFCKDRLAEQDDMPDYRSMPGVMITPPQEQEIINVDVVIVGSGAGGGVAAAILAQAGYSVLVVEKGPYVDPSQTTWLEAESFDQMYESSSLLTSSDGNIMILAGSTLGGGTTINWSCCLPLPDKVRQEWNDQLQGQFDQAEFETSQKAVMERIGCHTADTLNTMNQKLEQGCDTLKYKWKKTGQNLKDTSKEENGFVCFGDKYGNKQSGLTTYLHDAVQNGARIMENCTVTKVILEVYIAKNGKPRQRAVGIVGFVGKQKVTIKASKCVVVAAGALNTPCLLQRSWLKNPHIGQHLRLHPVTAVVGFYEQDIDSFLGSPMTGVCGEFENGPNQDGYGAKIECPSAHTGLAAAVFPFINPVHFRQTMLCSRKALPLIVLQRDSGQGYVCTSRDGHTPKVDYVVNPKDKQSMVDTMKGALQILIASGAKQVRTCHNRGAGFDVPSDEKRDEKIQTYLNEIDERGMKEHEMGFFCAHQMGSCRMSATPDAGVVDTNGETWECDDLFVLDTSIFPTASGANPMLTVLTLSHMLSTRLAKRLLHEDPNKQTPTNEEHSKAMEQLRQCRLAVSQAMPWTRGEKIRFGIAWSAVLLLAAKLFWSPSSGGTDRSEL